MIFRIKDGQLHEVHDSHDESLLTEVREIVTDPAHIAAEVTMEVVSYLLFGIVVAKLVRRHDKKVHGK